MPSRCIRCSRFGVVAASIFEQRGESATRRSTFNNRREADTAPSSHRMRRAFSFGSMYLGSSPFDAPGTYSLLQWTETVEGIWYPKGGFHQVRLRAELQCRCPVPISNRFLHRSFNHLSTLPNRMAPNFTLGAQSPMSGPERLRTAMERRRMGSSCRMVRKSTQTS